MNKKTVYVVNHGDKYSGTNPGMTEAGKAQVSALKPLLPVNPPLLITGAGKRHDDVREALNFNGCPTIWTPSVGGPESLEIIDGKKVVIMADGKTVPLDSFPVGKDRTAAMLAVLEDAPDNAVICAGRPAAISLGVKDAKSAAVYRVNVYCQEITGSLTLDNLQIQEVKATGVSEAGTV